MQGMQGPLLQGMQGPGMLPCTDRAHGTACAVLRPALGLQQNQED